MATLKRPSILHSNRSAAPPSDLRRVRRCCLASIVFLALPIAARADLALETETARLLPAGHVDLSAAFEFQTSSGGREYATPLAIEFGIFDRLELLIEPVAITSIQPKGGESATGIGDIETTLAFLVLKEQPFVPAIAIAGEVKFPSAGDRQIGSGEFDYRIYAVASKRLGSHSLSRSAVFPNP